MPRRAGGLTTAERHLLERMDALHASAPEEDRSLDAMRAVLGHLGDPQNSYRSVHITGTNGKTSTARYAAHLLEDASERVGLFTSPHLLSVRERIRVDGAVISDSALGELVAVVETAEQATGVTLNFFETTFACAALWFARRGVTTAVIEVGILGTLDATNVTVGTVAVATNIGDDHAELAGGKDRIAWDKAGIVKPSSHVVLGFCEASHLLPFEQRASRRPLAMGRDFDIHRLGDHATLRRPSGVEVTWETTGDADYQEENLAVAVVAVEQVLDRQLDDEAVKRARLGTAQPGRTEILSTSPLVVLDGAHNAAAAQALVRQVRSRWPAHSWQLVYGANSGHDWRSVVAALSTLDVHSWIVSPMLGVRDVPVAEVIAEVDRGGDVGVIRATSPAEALTLALGTDRPTLVTGSLYWSAPAYEATGHTGRSA